MDIEAVKNFLILVAAGLLCAIIAIDFPYSALN